MIKSTLTNAYMMFVMDLADPSTGDRAKIEKEIKCPLLEVFDCQRNCDRAKRTLSKEQFAKMLSLYFNAFNGAEGLDFVRLDHEIKKNRKQILRHLGVDKLKYLTLITSLLAKVDKKKGLLFEAVS